jgi:AcrR family transcriptional regulator
VQDGNQPNKQTPSPRRDQLLEASYQWVLQHGLADMSLRPLAEAVGSSPRVLLFLFGSKDDLIRALLARARRDELILLDRLRAGSDTPDLAGAAAQVWQWLAAPEHRDLLRLWCEGYACSLINPGGPWANFASQTVTDWLDLLAQFQPAESRNSEEAAAQRTYVLAILRGAMLDLLATRDISRTSAAITHLASRLRASASVDRFPASQMWTEVPEVIGRGKTQDQGDDGEQEKRDRERKGRVPADAQVGEDRAEEEQHQPDRSGHADERHGNAGD